MKRVSRNGIKDAKKMKLCVIGSGVVGSATGKGFAEYGHEVCFVDIDDKKISELRKAGYLAYTLEELTDGAFLPDVTFLTVPTPTINGVVDSSFMQQAAKDFGLRLKNDDRYQVLVVKSTVPPGTTEGKVIPLVERFSGKKAGHDFGVAMNPEYLREKSALEDFVKSWLVVIGEGDKKAGDMVAHLYHKFNCPVERTSIKEAELQKYIHNLYNANKISFFNEMREVCRYLGADEERVFSLVADSAEGIWNKKYGIGDFGPFGGACLPKDTQGFLSWARSNQLEMKLLAAVIAVNNDLLMSEAEENGVEKGVEKVRVQEWAIS